MGMIRGPRIKKVCEGCGVEFEVRPSCSTQRFCNHKCYFKSDEKHQLAIKTMTKNHQDPEFAEMTRKRGRESITNYNKSEKGRSTHRKTGHLTMTKLNQDLEFIEKRNKASTERINRLNQDPEFREKVSKTNSESMLRRLEDPEYKEMLRERSRKTFMRLNQDPEFCRKRDEGRRLHMINQIKNGDSDFGRAQRLLFERLLELDLSLSTCLQLEKRVSLTEDIVSRYSGSNKSYYRVDIAYVVNDQVKLAIEVDGFMNHSTEEEILKDKVRDNILLNEFEIKTIRIRNEEVFKDVDAVAGLIINEIQTF